MARFTMNEICLATKGVAKQIFHGEFTGISTDTRTVKPGDLFIPLVGEQFDGHNFIEQAISKGAVGILSSRGEESVPSHIGVIAVEDTLLALQDIARFHRKRFTIPVVAITGSNGKTTTKDMTAAILGSRFTVLKTEGNFNNEIGLPLTLLQLTEEHEVAVVEMGMRGKGQIRQLVEIALPTIGIITNVGETHMELLGSIEDIAEAKGELAEGISEGGLLILNGDDPYVRAMGNRVASRVTFFGLESGDIQGDCVTPSISGMDFQCHFSGKDFSVHIPALGKHNVYNALAGIAIGLELGLAIEEICNGIQQFNASPMRLHIKQMGDYVVINDAYNASPMSMAAAIDTLKEVAEKRTIAILGDMLELGSIAVEAHRQIGVKLAECHIDIVVTVGALASHIVHSAKEQGISKVIACSNHEEAMTWLKEILQPGDTILIKGSRGMKMENMVTMFL